MSRARQAWVERSGQATLVLLVSLSAFVLRDVGSSAWHTWQARRLLLDGEAEAALARCDEAMRHFERNVEARRLRVRALFALGRFEEGLTEAERGLALHPWSHELRLDRGEGLARLGRHAEAIRALEALLARVPSDGLPRTLLASSLLREGHVDEALAVLDAAEDPDADDAGALMTRGDALLLRERPAEALPCFERALSLSESGYAASGVALALAALGRAEEALPFARRGIEREPANRTIHLRMCFVLRSLGREDELDTAIAEALQRFPGEAGFLELQRRVGPAGH